ncbi:MAG: putative deoxyuridine 5'-triphosphate nucleotidohydrolase [Prokaryotic dsDNA virus sp.]|mgnify:CR=1 FL=1|nr:MAG: putative deoxyuridine 5'-triphosphate nucleotidohydrolase [Prokaryotic dsDNA virus sp.]
MDTTFTDARDAQMILSGKTIQRLDIMNPFYGRTRHKGMTFGCGPAGYDVRVEFDERGEIPQISLEPGEFRLASTIEQFNMPNNVLGIVHDKSTWARFGLAVQNTVIEPGWKGFLTLELTNHSDREIIIQREMPIAQIIFHFVDEATDGYEGKYQEQKRGPIMPILEGCP